MPSRVSALEDEHIGLAEFCVRECLGFRPDLEPDLGWGGEGAQALGPSGDGVGGGGGEEPDCGGNLVRGEASEEVDGFGWGGVGD